MSEKHEQVKDKNLYYCFVRLTSPKSLPDFYIVPAAYVAKYVRTQHRIWMRHLKHKVSPTKIRRFRISLNDPNHFKNAWEVFSK